MSEAATEGRRRTRGAGGGAARRAERTAVRIEAAKYIERNIPTMDILSEEALEIIERNAEIILEQDTVFVLSLRLPPAANSHKSSANARGRFRQGLKTKWDPARTPSRSPKHQDAWQ